MNNQLRVDVAQPLTDNLIFGLPNSGLQRMGLPVGISDAHFIHFNQRKFAHTAACQCFGNPGAHAAQANHHKVRIGECGQGRLAVKSTKAAKTLEVSGSEGSGHKRIAVSLGDVE